MYIKNNEATLPVHVTTRKDALAAFYSARRQMADGLEMALDGINAEISEVRADRK